MDVSVTADDERHRALCEARAVLKMDEGARQRYLRLVLRHRGQRAVNELLDNTEGIMREHRNRTERP